MKIASMIRKGMAKESRQAQLLLIHLPGEGALTGGFGNLAAAEDGARLADGNETRVENAREDVYKRQVAGRFVDLDDLPQHRFLPKQVVLFAIVREHSMARQRAALEIQQAGLSPSAP